VDLCEVFVAETRRSHDDVRAAGERSQDVRLRGVRLGVLDEDIARMGKRLGGRCVDGGGQPRLAEQRARWIS
jgi:hypothetical protein